MNYPYEDLLKTESDIRLHYSRLTELRRLKDRLRFLEGQKSQTENDINNSNVELNVSSQAFSFDREPIQVSGPSVSQQEKALESAFRRLERQLEGINEEILDTKIDIREMETQMYNMNFVLDLLDDTASEFVRLHYGKRIGYVKIAESLHISSATIGRLRIRALNDIRAYSQNMKRK